MPGISRPRTKRNVQPMAIFLTKLAKSERALRKVLVVLTLNIKRSRGPPVHAHIRINLNQSQRNNPSNKNQVLFKMLFRAAFLSAVALIGINQAVGATLEPNAAQIAVDSCLCPSKTQQENSILTLLS